MALVISAFVLVLLCVAPKPGPLDPARRLARLGTAIEMYTVRHDGRLPQTLHDLAEDDLLPVDFVESMSRQVKYVAAGRARDALPAHAVVALEDPSAVAGAIRVCVLLTDGAVVSVPADDVRAAARDDGVISRIESAGPGRFTVTRADAAE